MGSLPMARPHGQDGRATVATDSTQRHSTLGHRVLVSLIDVLIHISDHRKCLYNSGGIDSFRVCGTETDGTMAGAEPWLGASAG